MCGRMEPCPLCALYVLFSCVTHHTDHQMTFSRQRWAKCEGVFMPSYYYCCVPTIAGEPPNECVKSACIQFHVLFRWLYSRPDVTHED